MAFGRAAWAAALVWFGAGCGPEPAPPVAGGGAASWSLVAEDLPGALLSVWGTAADDVWLVGGDARDDSGPMVLHYDGAGWERIATGETQGDLWWVFGFAGGPIYMGGGGGVILRYQGGSFETMVTPGTGTVFGIWGAAPSDMWAVGGTFDKDGFAWRLEGEAWKAEPTLPAGVVDSAAVWKVFGRSASDVWLVGSGGVSFHYDGAKLEQAETGVGSSLFTVHANAERFAAVGGLASGIIVENDGSGWKDAGAPALNGLTGVALAAGDGGVAVGQYGQVLVRDAGGWQVQETGVASQLDLHGVWIDPAGGVWAVGGQTASFPLREGLIVHRGAPVAAGGL